MREARQSYDEYEVTMSTTEFSMLQAEEPSGPTLASPALAVKAGRSRGPTVLERRQREEEAVRSAVATKTKRKMKPNAHPAESCSVALADASLPNGVGIQGRGRAAMNMPIADGENCVAAMQERRQSLLAAAEFRPTRAVLAVAPAGAGKFDGMPDRDQYQTGAEGDSVWATDFESFVDSNFDGKGGELRTVDQHELRVPMGGS